MKKLMKRFTAVMMLVILTACFTGCSSDADEVYDYINEDVTELADLETKLTESYNGALSDTSVSSDDFRSTTVALAQELNDKAVKVSKDITNDEISKVHDIYVEYTELLLSSLNMLADMLESEDYSEYETMYAQLEESVTLGEEYNDALSDLAEKYDITLISQ